MSAEDTQPIPVISDPDWNLPVAGGRVGEIERHLPKPVLVRATVVAVAAVAAALLGKEAIDTSWVDPVLSIYSLSVPLVFGWWINRKAADPAVK
jgi:hypothetical protein